MDAVRDIEALCHLMPPRIDQSRRMDRQDVSSVANSEAAHAKHVSIVWIIVGRWQ